MLIKKVKKKLRKNNRRKGRMLQRRNMKIRSMINIMKRRGIMGEDMIISREGEEVRKMIGDIDDVNLLLRIEHYIII